MAFSNPLTNVSALGLSSGEVVVDFGAGSGFYTLAAARIVGDSGEVYAIDIQQELLSRVAAQAVEQGLKNVHTLRGDLDEEKGSTLADSVADALIMANTLFQVEHKEAFVREAARVLRRGGRLLCIDWTDSFNNLGPHPEQVVGAEKADVLLRSAGFEKVMDVPAGDHHYGMLYKKL